jgi:adenylosuccinate synthase
MSGVHVVVGGQYGSEGKGNIVATKYASHEVHVRVGSPNAGHTIYDPESNTWHKMQVIPCGWINRSATLIIGRGALIDIHQLQKELEAIAEIDPNIYDRLLIDDRAWCITSADRETERNIRLQESIGSTQEGVGQSRIKRLHRRPEDLDRQFRYLGYQYESRQRRLTEMGCDTVSVLNSMRRRSNCRILVEGTQGSGLSIYHGEWPYVTTTDTNVCGILSECGIAPGPDITSTLVVRTYPIRVAGNSGPLNGELDWTQVSNRVGRHIEERTTVTKKIRRVGEWDDALYSRSVMLNAPTNIALMFADYVEPELANKSTVKETVWADKQNKLGTGILDWMDQYTSIDPDRLVYLGTGPKSVITLPSPIVDFD